MGCAPGRGRSLPHRCVITFPIARSYLVGNERSHGEPLGPQEWWRVDLAFKIQLNSLKLRDWICRGWMAARQTPVQGYWIVWADDAELGRLRVLRDRSRRGRAGYPPELTTPP